MTGIGAPGRLVRSDFKLPDEAQEGPAGVASRHSPSVAGTSQVRQHRSLLLLERMAAEGARPDTRPACSYTTPALRSPSTTSSKSSGFL